jgi:menaquinone-9 beta-reductase
MVVDKCHFPRDKVCAGWITPQVVKTLQIELGEYRQNRTLQPINAFVAGLGRESAVTVRYDHAVSYGIRRCEFDDYLLRRSGARLKLGESLRSMVRRGDHWLINDSIETPFVVGGGGHFCPVARFLGANVGRDEPAIAAQEIEFAMDAAQTRQCGVEPATPELYFCDDLKGYAWCFRKGHFLNVGLGREDNHGLAEQLRSFWDWLASQGKIPAAQPACFKGHAYLLNGRSPRSIAGDGVLLIGDAAGLAYRQSGEGILPAIESGIMAAQVIIAANRDYSRNRLDAYRVMLEERFGARTSDSFVPRPAGVRTAFARSLLKTEWFTRHVVIDRWFLHARQKPMMQEPSAARAPLRVRRS